LHKYKYKMLRFFVLVFYFRLFVFISDLYCQLRCVDAVCGLCVERKLLSIYQLVVGECLNAAFS